jgi:hypothetical protein
VLQQAINLAEEDYLGRARRVIVIGQDTTRDPPQLIELMGGDIPPPGDEHAEILSASLIPIMTQERIIPKPEQTCGDLIAYELSRQFPITGRGEAPGAAGLSPEDEEPPADIPPPIARFLDAQGKATLDFDRGLIELELTGVPQPEGIPYEAQLLMWPDIKQSLGYFQPDVEGNATLTFTFKDVRSAPVDYYTLLGFSYVFLGQCEKGVPWLLDSVDIDPSPTNPAWQGLAECPDSPPSDGIQVPEGEEAAE